ncbi:MAG: ATP-dependent DNA helicase RecG [Acidimicrobiales bacterium]
MARTLPALRRLPVTQLAGVGPRKAEALGEMDVHTVLDLVTLYPRRYIDRTNQTTIKQLEVGQEAMVLVTVKRAQSRRARSGKTMVEVDITDGTGFLRCTFFNQPWRTRQLHEGTEAVVFGKVDVFNGRRQMTNPLVDLIGDRTGRIVPVYPQSEKAGLSTSELAGWVEEALNRAGPFADPLPDQWRDRLDLQDRSWAIRQVHVPDSMGAAMAARKRLAFDELLRLQVLLVQRKRTIEREATGIRHLTDGELTRGWVAGLPYELTGAQRRAMAEIAADLAGPHPMHRLLQGDVGSGKTLVAVAALLAGVQGGHQGALLAPTEVLAEQHDASVRALVGALTVPTEGANLFGERPVRVGLLTGRTPAADRSRLAEGMASGEVDIVVGTHALLTDAVVFRDLGVVVVDEQHRFGVDQRALLRAKGGAGAVPDVLVMTATPIPRTAAMTVYGDLDVTVLDQMPPGRTPIVTTWAKAVEEEAEAWERVRSEVRSGHQAFVVCPLVDESASDKVQARAATREFEELSAGELRGLRVGLLHGQMASKDKEAAMTAFRQGDIDVLVATTVIEVGVDVPNATVMVVLDAERFGIAQLHQLRGRVGRGTAGSSCYLLGETTTDDGAQRLEAVVSSTDGFALAEADLDIRGEGTILGIRQKGRNDLKLASLKRDRELVERAREVAFALVGDGTGLGAHPVLEAEVRDLVDDEEAEYLFKS